MDQNSPYLLFTPGPLSTTLTVRQAMLRELSTWDPAYHRICRSIGERLVEHAVASADDRDRYTTVLMQGSGTFVVESVIGSVVPADGTLLVASNGAYGRRMIEIARRLGIAHVELQTPEVERIDPDRLRAAIEADPTITHVAYVHCETTTGIVNDAVALGAAVVETGRELIVDAMSSFAGLRFDMVETQAHYLVSSANKCLQGVPGLGFTIADRQQLERTAGRARSLSLDLHDQWRGSEDGAGKLRFTSPTHVVLALDQALVELDEEGGVAARSERYSINRDRLVAGMSAQGFRTLLGSELLSPIITTFVTPSDPAYDFGTFHRTLKERGLMIYPGKVTDADTFRIGTIGDVHPADIDRLLGAIGEARIELGFTP